MNHNLPDWLERWLGVAPAQTGEGTIWALESAWPWAPWLTVLFVIAVSAFIGWLYWRELPGRRAWMRGLLIGLRLSLIALVLLMIAQLVLSMKRTGLPYVALVIDESASMSISDQFADPKTREALAERLRAQGFDEVTRLNLAKALLLANDAELLERLERGYQLRTYFLAENARPEAASPAELREKIRGLAPNGESTQVGRGLRTVLNDLRGTPPAAIVLLSDGISTEGETLSDVAAYARRKGVPIYAVGLGDDQPIRDLKLSDLLVDEVVFAGDIVQFEFTLEGSGYGGQQVEITLRESDSSEPVATLNVAVQADEQPQKIRLPYRPLEVGDFQYTLEVKPRPDEINPDNNRLSRMVSVRKEQIRVLLAQSYPNYEFRYLKNLLERDSTIELKTVLQEADPQFAEADRTALAVFPFRKEELFEFDVIIFGDVNPGFLSSSVVEHLADFVREKGGGLVLISGPQFMPQAFAGTPLESLIPVELGSLAVLAPGAAIEQGFHVVPTELGLASPPLQLGDTPDETRAIWQNLPEQYWYLSADRLKPAARVLAEHSSQTLADGRKAPLIVLEYAGAGKVLFHAMDETWRWRYQVGDIYFARYWIQSLRYLSRSKLLGKDRSAELSVDRREYRSGESVRLRLRFLDERAAPAQDDGVTVMLERDNGEQRSVTLRRVSVNQGVFEGTFPQPVEGDYHAWVTTPALPGRAPACDFLVESPPGELAELRMDSAGLERAAKQTGGKSYTFASARALLRDLPQGRQIPLDSLPAIALWNQWPILLLFLLLLVCEWILRKRAGLL